ncbi:MAG TPA: hypothetical protein VMT99_00935 [Candidatus Paceibacterota bacterium]|nr:hypothetical protein [Candidatus Paceibacterota bacterium]
MDFEKGQKGQSFVFLVLLIGTAIMLASLVLAFFAVSFVDVGYGYSALTQAQLAAYGGLQEALLQMDRNDAFTTSSYVFSVGTTTVTVSIYPDPALNNVDFVSSTATVSSRVRTMVATIGQNASSGQITVISLGLTE